MTYEVKIEEGLEYLHFSNPLFLLHLCHVVGVRRVVDEDVTVTDGIIVTVTAPDVTVRTLHTLNTVTNEQAVDGIAEVVAQILVTDELVGSRLSDIALRGSETCDERIAIGLPLVHLRALLEEGLDRRDVLLRHHVEVFVAAREQGQCRYQTDI